MTRRLAVAESLSLALLRRQQRSARTRYEPDAPASESMVGPGNSLAGASGSYLTFFLASVIMCLFVVASGGCSPFEPPPRSPTPEQDPARYEQARRAEERAKQQNQDAERILMKKRHKQLPVK